MSFLDDMKAVLPEAEHQNVNNHDNMELVRRIQVVAYSPKKAKEIRRRNAESEYGENHRSNGFAVPVDVRLYMGRSRNSSVVYCDIWVRTSDGKRWFSGSGQAGGYGYCKMSAAMDSALRSCGIQLSHSISGRGESAMQAAAEAVAVACGYRLFTIV